MPPVCSSSPFLPVFVDSSHQRADTSPFVYSFEAGYFKVVLVSVRLLYPLANLPNVALFPASLELAGAILRTPSPVVVRPVFAVDGDAGNAGSVFPQMSKARPACHVVPTAGSTTGGFWL